jgi:hypothetical protein
MTYYSALRKGGAEPTQFQPDLTSSGATYDAGGRHRIDGLTISNTGTSYPNTRHPLNIRSVRGRPPWRQVFWFPS